ncbi:hypothetical protein QCE48_01100 [Caballeronia sp. LZ024]|nr:hypothetical protein [Caballeronia sp. LZ024]MDR5749389.1 hypothetical protein [Caballeronia sp. LZ024]
MSVSVVGTSSSSKSATSFGYVFVCEHESADVHGTRDGAERDVHGIGVAAEGFAGLEERRFDRSIALRAPPRARQPRNSASDDSISHGNSVVRTACGSPEVAALPALGRGLST